VTAFTLDQWVILALIFLFGLVLGMTFMAGGKWKRRYREEARLREELQVENKRLHDQALELESLRHAAVKSERRDEASKPL